MTKNILSLLAGAFIWILSSCSRIVVRPDGASTDSSSTFYNFKMNDIDGNVIDFKTFNGKKVLIINVASKCGHTPQYADLQKLHEQYGDKVILLGFPANNFLHQEPGSNADISDFCKKNYGVTFLMFEKISVKGKDKSPLYDWLTDNTKNGWNETEPDWNFAKYLIDENGQLQAFFPSRVSPLDKEITDQINKP